MEAYIATSKIVVDDKADCQAENNVKPDKSVNSHASTKRGLSSPESSDGNSKKLRTLNKPSLKRIVLPSGSLNLSKVSRSEHALKIRKRRFVEKRLALIKVKNAKRVSTCVKAAISNGYIKIIGSTGLDLKRQILKGSLKCGHICKVTLADVLYQPDFVGVDQSVLSNMATVFCSEYHNGSCTEGWAFVTAMCTGKPQFDWTGQLINHCKKCDTGVFGVCVDDYKSIHCPKCGGHYSSRSCQSCFPEHTLELSSGSISSNESEIF